MLLNSRFWLARRWWFIFHNICHRTLVLIRYCFYSNIVTFTGTCMLERSKTVCSRWCGEVSCQEMKVFKFLSNMLIITLLFHRCSKALNVTTILTAKKKWTHFRHCGIRGIKHNRVIKKKKEKKEISDKVFFFFFGNSMQCCFFYFLHNARNNNQKHAQASVQ